METAKQFAVSFFGISPLFTYLCNDLAKCYGNIRTFYKEQERDA